jgi:protein TonB
MNAGKSNRILAWALAISIGAHVVLIFWAQQLKTSDASPPPPKPITTITILETPPPPLPTPPPRHALQHPHTSHTVAIQPPVLPSDHNPPIVPVSPPQPPAIGSPDPHPSGDGLGTPGPTARPLPACTAPDILARTVTTATLETPAIAQAEGLVGTVQVKVALDTGGAVIGASVYRSSGSSLLDSAAIRAAKESTYRPEIRNCEPVPGEYLFTATFQS